MARPTRRGDDGAERARLDELAEVYSAADALFAGHSCPASTECCRFGVTGREPYVTSVEVAALRRAIAALGGIPALRNRIRTAPDAELAGARPLPALRTVRDERRCAFLTDSGRCAVYEARPLGCRTYFCERATVEATVRHERVRELVRRVQDVAAKHRSEGDRGRPLTRALADLGM